MNNQNPSSPWHQLYTSPQQFDFFQAVHILEWTHFKQGHSANQIRFSTLPSLRFTESCVDSVILDNSSHETKFIICVTFMGLFGQASVLPYHYTELIIERMQMKDYHLRDFLDMFNHIAINWFYRAWRKHRADLSYQYRHYQPDNFTKMVNNIIGHGTANLQHRLAITDETLLYYSGILANQRIAKSKSAIQNIIAEYFAIPVSIKSYQESRININQHQRTSIGAAKNFNALGIETILGKYFYDVNHGFLLRLGPLHLSEFINFLPNGKYWCKLRDLIKKLTDNKFKIQLRLVLRADQVPLSYLAVASSTVLGWNAWLSSQAFLDNAEDTVFYLN